jgi:hypothetical protein
MDVVLLELKPVNDLSAELRYRVPGQVQYQSRSLPLAEIAGLYNFADRDFAKNNPDLAKIGQKLFNWLDGAERWLSRSIAFGASGAIDSVSICSVRLAGNVPRLWFNSINRISSLPSALASW